MPDGGHSLKICRGCGRNSGQVRFDRMSKNRCVECGNARAAQRNQRIAERGPRCEAVGEPGHDPRENPEHLDWIRKLPCAVHNHTCSKVRHAHHVRSAATAGTGMKPSDADTVCLCSIHHDEGHRIGWQSFQIRYGIGLRQLATDLAAQSPHIRKMIDV